MYELISREEKSPVRLERLIEELKKLFTDMPMALDSKGRDSFNPKYTQIKNFIFDISL